MYWVFANYILINLILFKMDMKSELEYNLYKLNMINNRTLFYWQMRLYPHIRSDPSYVYAYQLIDVVLQSNNSIVSADMEFCVILTRA